MYTASLWSNTSWENCSICGNRLPEVRLKERKSKYYCIRCHANHFGFESPNPPAWMVNLKTEYTQNNNNIIPHDNYELVLHKHRFQRTFYGITIDFNPIKPKAIIPKTILNEVVMETPEGSPASPLKSKKIETRKIKCVQEYITIENKFKHSSDPAKETKKFNDYMNEQINLILNKASWIKDEDIIDWKQKLKDEVFEKDRKESGIPKTVNKSENEDDKEDKKQDFYVIAGGKQLRIPYGYVIIQKVKAFTNSMKNFKQTCMDWVEKIKKTRIDFWRYFYG